MHKNYGSKKQLSYMAAYISFKFFCLYKSAGEIKTLSSRCKSSKDQILLLVFCSLAKLNSTFPASKFCWDFDIFRKFSSHSAQ